jgi:hypothetical protein
MLAVVNINPYREVAITSPLLPARCPSGVKWNKGQLSLSQKQPEHFDHAFIQDKLFRTGPLEG